MKRHLQTVAAAAFCFALVACKTNGGGNSQVKDIESVKKVTLVQGSDASGNAVAFITCAAGWIDKTAKKAEFAVPFNKVSNLSYTEMEAIYCTEPAGGAIIVGPGGGGNNPPPAGGGGTGTGDFTLIDVAACKSEENVDLPLIGEVKRVYLPGNVTDTYERCIVFGDEFERVLKKLAVIKKALIDKKIRVYAVEEDTFAFDDAQKKLTIPRLIKDKLDRFAEVGAKVVGTSGAKITVFKSNKALLWNGAQGGQAWTAAAAYCTSLGAPWEMPTRQQLMQVATDLNDEALRKLTNHASGNYSYVNVKGANNPYASSPGSWANEGTNYNGSDMSGLCVIDASN